MNNCTFDKAWIGTCGKPNCQEHKNIPCSCCGAPAVRECPETFGLVCGSPLCADCVHELTEDGVNYSGCRHVRKGEQKHLPWYMREDAAI